MEDSIDQFLSSIEYSKETLYCTPSPQLYDVKGIPYHVETKETCVPSHDHSISTLE